MIIKPHILLISFVFSPNIGGVESHLDDLCDFSAKEGHKITVITYQPLITKAKAPYLEKKENLEIRRIPWLRFNLFNRLEKMPILEILYLVPPIFIYSFFYLLFNNRKIDIIQVHGFNMAIVGYLLSLIFRKRFNINTHVSFSFIKGTFYARVLSHILNRASKILVLTESAKKELIKIGVESGKIIVYHQWIDTRLFKPKDKFKSRGKYKLDENKFIVFFAGRFVAAKGVNLLLEAALKVNDNIQFVFVGSGPMKDLILKKAKGNHKIKFVGMVDRLDLPYYYSLADTCIIPSIQATQTYAEGIPRVMIEAFTCGTPVIATKSGGTKELITEKVGFFVSPNSAKIAELLNELSENKKRLSQMRSECIKYAEKEFGLINNAKIIENTLQ